MHQNISKIRKVALRLSDRPWNPSQHFLPGQLPRHQPLACPVPKRRPNLFLVWHLMRGIILPDHRTCMLPSSVKLHMKAIRYGIVDMYVMLAKHVPNGLRQTNRTFAWITALGCGACSAVTMRGGHIANFLTRVTMSLESIDYCCVLCASGAWKEATRNLPLSQAAACSIV